MAGNDEFITLRGLRLHYVDWGGHGSPLLLLHGLQDCAHMWDFFAERMVPHFRVIGLDHRGHGDSQWTADGLYRLDDYVGEAQDVIDALDLQAPVVMGHSAGSKNAFIYAASPGAKLSKLVITDMDPDASANNPGSRGMFVRYNSESDEWDNLDAVVERLRLREPKAPEATLRHHAEVLTNPLPGGRRVWKRDRNVVNNYKRPDAWAYLPKVRVPTLIVRGGESDLLTHDVAVRMQSLIPDCRLVELPTGGHWGHEEEPEAFEHAVKAFLGV